MSILQSIRSRLTQKINPLDRDDADTTDDGDYQYETPSSDM